MAFLDAIGCGGLANKARRNAPKTPLRVGNTSPPRCHNGRGIGRATFFLATAVVAGMALAGMSADKVECAYIDAAAPRDMTTEIALAANAGIDVFLYDYCWSDGKAASEQSLKRGFLCAKNRNRMKFALMWRSGESRKHLMTPANAKNEFLELIDHCIANYFSRPEYWRKHGGLFFSICNASAFYEMRGKNAAVVRAELDEARRRVRAAGLGEIHFNAQDFPARLPPDDKACGFDSMTDCGTVVSSISESCAKNTPADFRKSLAAAKKRAERDARGHGVVYIDGWNKSADGTYRLSDIVDSDSFLRAVAAVFGRHPSSEYKFVDPMTKMLYTTAAATFEDVAYGTHPKQKIDVYLPNGAKSPAPVVMYMHGGSWTSGAIVDRIIGTAIPGLLEKGVAVVCTSYRYIGDAKADGVKPPVMGCLDDCECALQFVKSHAQEWNIDTSRIGLAGGSAGACTALYLALKDDCISGVKAVAPIIAQTSMDPAEMRKWIPNSSYGAHAFGCRGFNDWLAHRAECLADVERISPAALLRKATPARVPQIRFLYSSPVKPGELAKDPTHSPVFGERFKEIADRRGVKCEIGYGNRNNFGDAFTWLADTL